MGGVAADQRNLPPDVYMTLPALSATMPSIESSADRLHFGTIEASLVDHSSHR